MSFDNLKKFLTLPKMQFGGGFNPNNPMSRYDYVSPFQFPQSPNTGMPVYSGYNPDFEIQQTNPYYGMPVNSGYVPTQAPPSINWLSDLNSTISQNVQVEQPQVAEQQRPQLEAVNLQPQGTTYGTTEQQLQANTSSIPAQGVNLNSQTNQQTAQPFQLFNPFGGVDTQSALAYGFYNFGQGNTGQGLLGLSKGLLGSARQGFSAYGLGKQNRNLMNQQNNQPVVPIAYGELGGTFQAGGSVMNSNLSRSYYDPRLERINYGNDYINASDEKKKEIELHENYHDYQKKLGRTNFNIAHSTDFNFQETAAARPQLPTTEDEWRKFHNRSQIEADIDVFNFKNQNPQFSFIPDNLLYDKIIDGQTYNNPYSLEGEAVTRPIFKKGGEISVGKFLSGKYITDSSNPTVEIEKSEQTLNSETGEVQKAIGETHEKGGVKTNLPEGSQVLSDHTKIGAKNAKELSKELDIKVKAKNTFADVLDKYSKKIGVEKNIEEGEKLVNQTEDTLRLPETDTKQINLDFIQQETARIETEKEELNTQQQEAFKTIFDKQEAQKGSFLQEGGEIAPATQEEEMNPNDIIFQVQQAIAQGAPIEEIVNNLLSMGYSEDEASQIIQASQSQQQPQMEDGGTSGEPGARIGDFLKSANLIAQTKGVEPPKVDLSKGDLTKNWTELQNWFVKNAPEEVISYFEQQPITNKGMEILLKNKKTELKNLGIDTNRKPNSFTLEEKRAIQEAIPLDDKFILDQFADGKVDYRFPQVSATSMSSITPQSQAISASMASPSGNGFQEQPITGQDIQTSDITQNPVQRGRNVIPMLPVVEGLTPSAALIPRADQVRFNRLEPTLRTPEASIAAINNQTNFVNQQAFQSNPNLAPFLIATNLGTTQQSVNKAIAETDAYNAEAVNRANTYNANIGDKEQLMNINLAQNYEQRLFKTIDNQEQAWSRYLVNKQLQNKQNWMDVNNLNLTNAMTPNYQTDGSNVYFSNPRQYNQVNPELQAQQQMWQSMTPEQRAQYVSNYKQDGGYIYGNDNQSQEVTGFTYLTPQEFIKFQQRQKINNKK